METVLYILTQQVLKIRPMVMLLYILIPPETTILLLEIMHFIQIVQDIMNTASGTSALRLNTTGSNNTANGYNSRTTSTDRKFKE